MDIHKDLYKGDAAMRSPHDPDATTGRKGVGYHVQVAETCNNECSELITDFEVTPAHVPDNKQAPNAINRLDERGLHPEICLRTAAIQHRKTWP